MMAMVLRQTGNLDLIRAWILGCASRTTATTPVRPRPITWGRRSTWSSW
jgi:hypothetical protein